MTPIKVAASRGVFQTLSTRGRGGPLYTVEWNDPECVCQSMLCPAEVTVTGLDGHGLDGRVRVEANGTTTVIAGGFG